MRRAELQCGPMLGPAPFVLLDDARPGGADARLYRDPVRIVTAHLPGEVQPALDALDAARAAGLHAAGYLAYEAGHALEPKLAAAASRGPLLWFGLFEGFETIAANGVPALLPAFDPEPSRSPGRCLRACPWASGSRWRCASAPGCNDRQTR